jgi:hypothetical protein
MDYRVIILALLPVFVFGQNVNLDKVNARQSLTLRGNRIDSFSIDRTFASPSNNEIATQKAVYDYISGIVSGLAYLPITGGTLTGTGGSGFVGIPAQSSAPSTPSSGFRFYADASGRLAWKGTNGFVRVFDGVANTADRVYTLPNASGTFGLLGSAQSWTGINTFAPTGTGGAGFMYSSTTQPFHGPPNMTTAQMNALTGMLAGDQVFNITENQFFYYTGSAWVYQPRAVNTFADNQVLFGSGKNIQGDNSLLTYPGNNFGLPILAVAGTSTTQAAVGQTAWGLRLTTSLVGAAGATNPIAYGLDIDPTISGTITGAAGIVIRAKSNYAAFGSAALVIGASNSNGIYISGTSSRGLIELNPSNSSTPSIYNISSGSSFNNFVSVRSTTTVGDKHGITLSAVPSGQAHSTVGIQIGAELGVNNAGNSFDNLIINSVSANSATERFRIMGQTGFFGFGTNAPTSFAHFAPPASNVTGDLSGAGYGLRLVAATYTNTTTAAAGTVANAAAASFESPTIASANTGVTYSNFSTVAIYKPIAGGNSTITRNYGMTIYGDNNSILAQSTTTLNQRTYIGPDYIGISRLSDGGFAMSISRLGSSSGGDLHISARDNINIAIDTRAILGVGTAGVVVEINSAVNALQTGLGVHSIFDVNSSVKMARPFPRMTGSQISNNGTWGGLNTISISNAGSGYTPGTYNGVSVVSSTGNGSGATVNVTVGGGGTITTIVVATIGARYDINDVLTVSAASIGGTGSGFSFFSTLLSPQAQGGFVVNTSTNKLLQYNANFGLDGIVTERMPNAFTNTNTFLKQIGIGTASPHASALVDMVSTIGGLLIPRGTDANISAVASPPVMWMMASTTSERINVKRTDGFYQIAYTQDIRRDSTYKTVNANLDLSALTTTFKNRFHTVRIKTILTAAASGNNTITMPVPSADLLGINFKVSVEDTSGDGDISVISFGTDGADGYLYNGDGTFSSSLNAFPGLGIYMSVAWCEAKSAYRWELQ